MSDQQIHSKITDAAKQMHLQALSQHLVRLETNEPIMQFSPRFCMDTQKEYRRALFQAALNGNIHTLDALTEHLESTHFIDQDSCDNALWVAVAEQQTEFALALLKTKGIRVKITLPGVKEAMKLSLEQQDQSLTKALLQFVAESNAHEHAAMTSMI